LEINIDFPKLISARSSLNDFIKDDNPFKSIIIARAEIVEDVSKLKFDTGGEDLKENDFIVIKSVFVTSQPYKNGNKDSFRKDDLTAIASSDQFSETKPGMLDVNHNFFPFGTVIGKELLPAKVMINNKKHEVIQIAVYSVLWAWRFPELAEKVREWGAAGLLKFSMACKATAHQCGMCGTIAENVDDYCEHLTEGTYNERILIEPKFYANSIITPDKQPADENANALEVGQYIILEGDDMKKIIKGEDELYWITKDAMWKVLDSLFMDVRQILSDSKSVISKIKTAFDTARDNYLMLFKQLKQNLEGAQVYTVNLEKRLNKYTLDNLIWLLSDTLWDVEHSGVEDSDALLKQAFDDAKNKFVELWKALDQEQKDVYKNQKVIVSNHLYSNKLKEREMEISEKLKEIQAKLDATQEKLDAANVKISEFEALKTEEKIKELEAEIAGLKEKLAKSDKKIDELNTAVEGKDKELEKLNSEKAELEKTIEGQKELVLDAKKKEVDTINLERAEKIDKMKLSDENKEFWKSEFTIAFNEEDGSFSDPKKEMYEKFVANIEKDETEDSPVSEKVITSQKNDALHTDKTDEEGDKYKTIA
jgi:hypothetical protein